MTSCAEVQIAHQAASFNRAIETSSNEQLLLNAVRASEGLPVYFTRLSKYTGGNMLQGSLAPKFPFGPQAVNSNDIGMTASWSSGVSTIEFGDLNTDEALLSLNRQIEFGVFDRYVMAGVSSRLMATLATEAVEIYQPLQDALMAQYNQICSEGSDNPGCQHINSIRARCDNRWIETSAKPFVGGRYVQHFNHPKSECAYLRFQAILSLLSLSGFTTEAKEEKFQDFVGKDKVTKTKMVAVGVFGNRNVLSIMQNADRYLKRYGRQAVTFSFRSPKRMVEFLGEIIALQNYSATPYVAQLPTPTGPVAVFRVIRGDAGAERVALSVRSPQGETFIVPQPDLSSPNHDQSLVALSIVSDLVNLSIKKSALPPPTTIEVRTAQ